MTDTLIKVDLNQPATENEQIHNRWHPDIPMACWVKPGDDFILETYDWTAGAIKNNDDASDVRDVDLSTVHYLSGPVGVHGAEPGICWWSTCWTSAPRPNRCGVSTVSSRGRTVADSSRITFPAHRKPSGISKACSPARGTFPGSTLPA